MNTNQIVEVGKALLPYLREGLTASELGAAAHNAAAAIARSTPNHEPSSWMAMTGTAGTGTGCNKPFWLQHEAAQYVKKHGGYIRPLFTKE
jgi:hypothetical protein